jgi:two-component system, chemotaxis family, chemotaxis protein CheY
MHIDYSAPILVVDDQQVMVDLTMRVLTRIGFDAVDHARDGQTALDMLRRRKYQLVISDLFMEPISGLEILRTIRADHGLEHTPFLLMTGDVGPGAVIAAKHARADAYLLKPFTPEQLRTKLDEIFSRPRR